MHHGSDTTGARYSARSASDRTDDWPYWFVADRQRGGLNITGQIFRNGSVLTDRGSAEFLADELNKPGAPAPRDLAETIDLLGQALLVSHAGPKT